MLVLFVYSFTLVYSLPCLLLSFLPFYLPFTFILTSFLHCLFPSFFLSSFFPPFFVSFFFFPYLFPPFFLSFLLLSFLHKWKSFTVFLKVCKRCSLFFCKVTHTFSLSIILFSFHFSLFLPSFLLPSTFNLLTPSLLPFLPLYLTLSLSYSLPSSLAYYPNLQNPEESGQPLYQVLLPLTNPWPAPDLPPICLWPASDLPLTHPLPKLSPLLLTSTASWQWPGRWCRSQGQAGPSQTGSPGYCKLARRGRPSRPPSLLPCCPANLHGDLQSALLLKAVRKTCISFAFSLNIGKAMCMDKTYLWGSETHKIPKKQTNINCKLSPTICLKLATHHKQQIKEDQ